jgi:predicted nucleotidyltransferase
VDNLDRILASLKRASAALRDAGVPYAVGGGLAFYAYGGDPGDHDVDLMLREQDAERAQQVLAEAGMRPENPPEEWLLKAHDGDVLVDLIFAPEGLPITDEVLARARDLVVDAMHVPVLDLADALVTRLLAFNERSFDVVGMLGLVRELREQVDWAQLRDRTADSPFAQTFLDLAERLDIAPVREGAR